MKVWKIEMKKEVENSSRVNKMRLLKLITAMLVVQLPLIVSFIFSIFNNFDFESYGFWATLQSGLLCAILFDLSGSALSIAMLIPLFVNLFTLRTAISLSNKSWAKNILFCFMVFLWYSSSILGILLCASAFAK